MIRFHRLAVPSCLILTLVFFGFGCASGSTTKTLSDEERAAYMVRAAADSIRTGDPTQALRDLLDAEKYAPNLPELHHAKALAYFSKHQLDSAIQSAKRATDLNPKYSAGLNTLGKLLIDKGELAKAEPPLLLAANDLLYSEAYKARTNLSMLYYRQSRFDEAEVQADMAIQSEPNLACVAYYYRGNLQLRKNRYDQAIESYERATRKLCGNFPEAHYAQGIAFLRSKRIDQARKRFVDVTKLFPGTREAEKALAELRFLPP
jgi:Tfp pilus assembly protein PilF